MNKIHTKTTYFTVNVTYENVKTRPKGTEHQQNENKFENCTHTVQKYTSQFNRTTINLE